MAIFTAAAAFVSAAVGGGLFGAIAGFAARTLLTVGISKLIGNRAGANAAGTSDVGSRVHVPPASNNKLPVVYGKAYMGSTVTDMKISEDGK
jgi:predicted phage tail protein